MLRNVNVTTPNAKIVKNTLFLSLRMVFVLFVSLYTSRVFLNVLGVVDYGISNVVAGFVSMFGFLNTSLASSIQRFYSAEMGTNGKAGVSLNMQLSVVILLGVGVTFGFYKFCRIHQRKNTKFYQWMQHIGKLTHVGHKHWFESFRNFLDRGCSDDI